MTEAGLAVPDIVLRLVAGRPDWKTQLDAFLSMSVDRQGKVAERLMAVEKYLHGVGRTRADATAAGELAGLRTRAFYKLLADVEEYGPVLGSAPYAKRKDVRKVRRAPVRDGLEEIAEAAIREALQRAPEASFSEIQKLVQDAMGKAGLKPPAPNTLSRRLMNIRGRTPRYMAIGREIMVLQEPTSFMPIVGRGTVSDVATIVLDVDTKIVLAVEVDRDPVTSLVKALDMLPERVGRLADLRAPFSTGIEKVVLALHNASLEDDLIMRSSKAVSFEIARLHLSDAQRATILKSIFRAAGDLEGEGGPLASMSPLLSRRADVWNERVLSGGRRRARAGTDKGEAVVRAMSHLASAVSPIRAAV